MVQTQIIIKIIENMQEIPYKIKISNVFQTKSWTKIPFIEKKKKPNIDSAFWGNGSALNAAKYQKNMCNNKGIFLKNST